MRRPSSAILRLSRLGIVTTIVFAWGASPSVAEKTRTWEQQTFQDFEKGKAEKVTIRSDGKLFLAPRFRELLETPSSYLWDLVRDGQGNLFASGGPDAAVLRIGVDGESTAFFKVEDAEIHALAVDREDNVYAATSPDPKVYRISPSGESSVLFEPDANYVWDMAFDSQGNLFLATGDKGRVYRVRPSGKGDVFFETDETHVRAVMVDAGDNLIIGTDPGGLIIRLSNPDQGEPKGFVLYQSSKKEITALGQASDGTIYAAGVGARSKPAPITRVSSISVTVTAAAPASPAPTPLNPRDPAAPTRPTAAPLLPPPAVARAQLKGGSEVYRISPDGEPRVMWKSNTDIVYAIGLDPDQKPLIGTGNRGRLIRLDSSTEYSLVLTAPSSQITAMASDPEGKVFIATSGIGKVYQLGPQLETEGYFQAEAFDGKIFSRWGRIEWRGQTADSSKIEVSTRSGNSRSTARNWSEWSPPVASSAGENSQSPPARFAQWKALLSAPADGDSPVLDSVSLFYLRKNIEPVITHVEVTPPNYKFPDKPATLARKRRTLPPLGQPRREVVTVKPQQAITPAKGYVGIRWAANDANKDKLVFTLEIRGEQETAWKLLKEEVESDHLSWDSTSFPDGWYQVRIKASDRLSNPAAQELNASRISDPFMIDNGAARISDLTARFEDGRLAVRFRAADTTTKISRAQYSLDGSDWKPIRPVSLLFDSRELSFEFQTDPVEAGEHTVAVRVYDAYENLAAEKAVVR